MSNKTLKKGKEHAKAVFVESSAQMTKSRNMAEENILRQKLKGLEDQRRRSIMAFNEKEKTLIRELETQRGGSLTPSASGTDKDGTSMDQIKYANTPRQSSWIPTDDSGNVMNSKAVSFQENNDNKDTNSNNDGHYGDKNVSESRKHLWKYSKSVRTPPSGKVKTFLRQDLKAGPGRTHGDSDKVHILDTVMKDSSQNNLGEHYGCVFSTTNRTNDSNKNINALSHPCDPTMTGSISLLSTTNSFDIDCSQEPRISKEQPDIWIQNRGIDREDKPIKANTKSEERWEKNLQKLSSFDELDSEVKSSNRMKDKHAKTRSVNINPGNESIQRGRVFNSASIPVEDYCNLNNKLTKDIKQLSNCLSNSSLTASSAKTSIDAQSSPRNGTCPNFLNKPFHISESYQLEKNLPDTFTALTNKQQAKSPRENPIENAKSVHDESSALIPQTHLRNSKQYERRNSVDGRNKILLSPITSRCVRSQASGYIPTVASKHLANRPAKKRRSVNDEKVNHLKQVYKSKVISDSESVDSNVSTKGYIPDNHRNLSVPNNLDRSIKPVSSWSQRKRSIVFGEKSPHTPRDLLNDTHAQWEELGDFLGEIRKQHNMNHTRLSNGHQCDAGSRSSRDESQPRRISNFATLVEERLLPRRHSESNIILLSHAAKGQRDVSDYRQKTAPRHARRKSFLPPDQSCSIAGPSTKSTSVKKLVTIHNALQSSALSMADMESDQF